MKNSNSKNQSGPRQHSSAYAEPLSLPSSNAPKITPPPTSSPQAVAKMLPARSNTTSPAAKTVAVAAINGSLQTPQAKHPLLPNMIPTPILSSDWLYVGKKVAHRDTSDRWRRRGEVIDCLPFGEFIVKWEKIKKPQRMLRYELRDDHL